jgi:hypothetical protein
VFAAADHLAQKPPQALAISRRLVRQDPAPVIARMREEAEHFSIQLKSAKRWLPSRPSWRGRSSPPSPDLALVPYDALR